MDMSLFPMLLLSGLLYSASGLWRNYHYIDAVMSWSSAQSYCRKRFTDLATVDSMDNVNMMMNSVNDGYNGSVWIGLKRGIQNQLRWSMGDAILTQYIPWGADEPNRNGECVMFRDNLWWDLGCAFLIQFVCYDENTGYHLIQLLKNWTDAQSYCRQYHADLATVDSAVEQDIIHTAVGQGKWVWIGLYSDSWQWSDQWRIFFRNWAVGHQFTSSGSDCVVMSTTDSGKWIQSSCDQQHPFICYGDDKFVEKQTVRFYFAHDENHNLADSSLQTAVMNKIIEKLKSLGLKGYKNISWKTGEDGEMFHLVKRTVHSSNICEKNFK